MSYLCSCSRLDPCSAPQVFSESASVPHASAVCSDFELKEGRRPVLADLEQLQSSAQLLGREAASQAAAEHPGTPLPREAVTEDILPTEVCTSNLSVFCSSLS